MQRMTSYYVLTTAKYEYGPSDHGSWSRHNTLAQARECAQSVKGDVYRRTVSLSPDHTRRLETMRLVP